MNRFSKIWPVGLLAIVVGAVGCASAARDTTGYAITSEVTVSAPFEDAWQLTKTVLRENELDIFTRDTRGIFVAFTPDQRRWRVAPHRQKFTIVLTEVSSTATHLSIETVDQVYGVTLLTYPDWHDRPATGDDLAKALLEAIQAKASGA